MTLDIHSLILGEITAGTRVSEFVEIIGADHESIGVVVRVYKDRNRNTLIEEQAFDSPEKVWEYMNSIATEISWLDDDREIFFHEHPAWGDRADTWIYADFTSEGGPESYEQLPARRLGPNEYEICCIPFRIYDVALGDTVSCKTSPQIGTCLDKVERPSGRYVFRALFSECHHSPEGAHLQTEIISNLLSLGAMYERLHHKFISIDARNESEAQIASGRLAESAEIGELVYETGRL